MLRKGPALPVRSRSNLQLERALIRLSNPVILVVVLLLAGALVAACGEPPTAPDSEFETARVDAAVDPNGKPFLGPTLHFAIVQADGTLVGGTATSAERRAEGIYSVQFPPPVDVCAGSASSTFFPTATTNAARVVSKVVFGFGPGGMGPSNEHVNVHFSVSDTPAAKDTPFSLVLLCS